MLTGFTACANRNVTAGLFLHFARFLFEKAEVIADLGEGINVNPVFIVDKIIW